MRIRYPNAIVVALLAAAFAVQAQDPPASGQTTVPPAEDQQAAIPPPVAEAEGEAEAPTSDVAADAPEAGEDTAAPAAMAEHDASAEVDAKAPGDGLLVPAQPPEGKGQVVFFREKKFQGAAIIYKVREGDEELGQLNSGTYFIHVAEPGTHEYAVRSEAKDVLHLEVEPGETYYVSGSVTMGFLAGRPNLSPSDEDTFLSMSDKLKPAKKIK